MFGNEFLLVRSVDECSARRAVLAIGMGAGVSPLSRRHMASRFGGAADVLARLLLIPRIEFGRVKRARFEYRIVIELKRRSYRNGGGIDNEMDDRRTGQELFEQFQLRSLLFGQLEALDGVEEYRRSAAVDERYEIAGTERAPVAVAAVLGVVERRRHPHLSAVSKEEVFHVDIHNTPITK